MIVGIYARQSIYSDKSDSIEAQVNMCKEYVRGNYKDVRLVLSYDDEGYTGANTSRPGYRQLIEDIKSKKINVLVCYKIDRISRNVLDFSKTFELLQANDVSFVSVKEQIDTSTPLGRAMMYISSVFAQMERETTAERVKDSMIELAKKGCWAGGRAPVGFKRKRININGKQHTVLEANEGELPYLNMVFDTFLEGYSLSGLETHFRKSNIKSINGNYMSAIQIYNVLRNPHYAQANEDTYRHFEALGCIMAVDKDKFDGKHGLIVYGRTSGGRKKTHKANTHDKWIVAVGLHKPLISAEKWLKVQERFGVNKINKTRKNKIGLLRGVMKCKCGYTMRVQRKHDRQYDKIYDYYFCQYRNRRGKEFCDMPMTQVHVIDDKIMDLLKELSVSKDMVKGLVKQDKKRIVARGGNDINRDISTAKSKINNLTTALQANSESTATKYIIAEIEKLDKKLIGLNYELLEFEEVQKEVKKNEDSAEDIYNKIRDYLDNFNELDYDDRNWYLMQIIKECTWNGKDLVVTV